MKVTSSVQDRRPVHAMLLGYGLVAAGPISVAAANFALSFSMLRLESAEAFGSFTFLFVATAFMISLAGALFAAPLQALFATSESVVSTILAATVLVMAMALPVYAGLGLAFGLSLWVAISYGVFASLTILRAVGRAWCYTIERPRRVTLSDGAYAFATLAAFAGLVLIGHLGPAHAVYLALAAGTILAVACLGREFALLLRQSHRARLRDYGSIWRQQSRWSLLAVTTNEVAANAHIYLLTLFAGAATLAPVAAGALLLRPINVVQNALVDFERAQMARHLATSDKTVLGRSVRQFRAIVLLGWLATVILAAALLILRPDIVIPAHYRAHDVYLATALWSLVWLVIAIQLPSNVLLQAADKFSALSRASVTAAIVSVAGVLVAIAARQPIWTVAALVPGWTVSTVMIARVTRKLRLYA